MSCDGSISGRVDQEASGPGSFTLDDVQERLVEAMLTCWRHPDRERGWQRLRAHWPDIERDSNAGDYDARGGAEAGEMTIRPASLTRLETAEMEEAFGWLDHIRPQDRKLVGLAITALASGKREVPWRQLLRPMGLTRGSDGLRVRYGRAIAAIAARASGGNPRANRVNPNNLPA